MKHVTSVWQLTATPHWTPLKHTGRSELVEPGKEVGQGGVDFLMQDSSVC